MDEPISVPLQDEKPSAEGVLFKTIPAFQQFLIGLTIDLALKRPRIGFTCRTLTGAQL